MDKVLAFSILSASPADIAAGAGSGTSRARFSWKGRKLRDEDQGARAGQEGKKQGGPPTEAEQQPGKGKSPTLRLPRLAPEFDGIDCFETIVCH
ncbi:hypothetical protein D1007_30415 [Hordeum vulgare]|uniref:uncharacterized protein LOC123449588 isoform X3 n=1 Tax=Hordeum vulgare subsp. vulgare TaxID=112509 RepID=UPI001D1A3951|nr:uncharacterized protein LOC123449588 isoform X3 [Hordeum vulgare subsp. vulgare]XP_044982825.1 uncharacterized protein LOC123449588 isoform X3 [Hordeum vulgare subsp. vulgare]KAE8794849.1 hypothetical protein D1007_30415 [Hordeum vulgare]